MRRLLIAAAAVTVVGAASGALAEESRHVLPSASEKVSTDTICQGLEGMGYHVLRIEAEGDRYEARIVGDNGVPVAATYDAATRARDGEAGLNGAEQVR